MTFTFDILNSVTCFQEETWCDIQNTRFNMIPQPPSYQRYQCYQHQEWFYKAAAEQLKSRPDGLVVIAICCYTPSIHGSLTNMYQMSPVEIATPVG